MSLNISKREQFDVKGVYIITEKHLERVVTKKMVLKTTTYCIMSALKRASFLNVA